MQQSSFYPGRLGTNIRKALKNDYRFLQVVKFEDGTVQNYSTFERPHFVFNGAKNGIFEPFIYKNEHFAKTGSGQP
jgi:hypothetical protein